MEKLARPKVVPENARVGRSAKDRLTVTLAGRFSFSAFQLSRLCLGTKNGKAGSQTRRQRELDSPDR